MGFPWELMGFSSGDILELQLLQLTLEGLGGQWCEPLDIDVVGVSVRVIEYKGHKVTLIVKVKQLSGVQKQVCGLRYN